MKKLILLLFLFPLHSNAQITQAHVLGNLATEAQKQAWMSLFDNKYAKMFISNYIDGKGKTIVLSEQDVANIDAEYFMALNKPFMEDLFYYLKNNISQNRIYQISANSGGGTLGYFYATVQGQFTYKDEKNMSVEFRGRMTLADRWDFDWSKHRPQGDEYRTRFASLFLMGKPFNIVSQPTDFTVNCYSSNCQVWLGKTRTTRSPDYSAFGKHVKSIFARVFGN